MFDDAPKVVTLLALPIPDPPTPKPDEEKTEEERNKDIALKEFEERKKGSESKAFSFELREELGPQGLIGTETFEKYKDVKIKIEDEETKEIHEFSAITYPLVSNSTFFQKVICNNDSNKDDIYLNKENVSPEIFQLILNYIHFGSINLTPSIVFDLLFTSDYLGIKQLTEDCINYYIDNLSPLNISDFYYITFSTPIASGYKEILIKWVNDNNHILFLKNNIIYLSFEVIDQLLFKQKDIEYLSEYELAYGIYYWYMNSLFYDRTNIEEKKQLKEYFVLLLHNISWENVPNTFVSYYINTSQLRNELGEKLIDEIVIINEKAKEIDGYIQRDESQYRYRIHSNLPQYDSLVSMYDIRIIEEFNINFPMVNDVFDMIFNTLYLFTELKVIRFIGKMNNSEQWNKIMNVFLTNYFSNLSIIDFTGELSLSEQQLNTFKKSKIQLNCPKLLEIKIHNTITPPNCSDTCPLISLTPKDK